MFLLNPLNPLNPVPPALCLPEIDAAALGVHFGSVSVVTFAVARRISG